MKTFVDRVLNDEIDDIEVEINDAIAKWHASSKKEKRELHEYLGLTWEQYQEFVRNPGSIYKSIAMQAKTLFRKRSKPGIRDVIFVFALINMILSGIIFFAVSMGRP